MKARKAHWLMPVVALGAVAALHLAQGTGEAFITIARWGGNSTEYVTAASLGVAPFPATTPGLVNTAAARWSQPSTGIPFTIVNFNGQIGPVRMQVGSGNLVALGFPDVPGVNSLTFSGANVTSSFLRLNSTWIWNTSCTLNQAQKRVDVLTITLHEMGHSVALNHDPNQTGAVMWPNYVCKQTLRTDDRNGIDALY
jgi:hypothetical protein